MSSLKQLQFSAKKFSILYVEDNEALRDKVDILLNKFFGKVDSAEDGESGLQKFKNYHYSIVITDIKMPKMDGLTLAKHIKHIQPDTKVIVMSAFDDKELLLKGIELGVFRFLTKPVDVHELADVLLEAVIEIEHEQSVKIFYTHIQTIFNYQSSMVVMMNREKIVLANQIFLDFFDLDTIDDYHKKYREISSQFMKHDGFLYDFDDEKCIDIIVGQENKLFHVKMKSRYDEIKHFILKYQSIPEKENHGILSFDDVTELNLLQLFNGEEDEENLNSDENEKALQNLLTVIQENRAKIKIYDYYKGLTITNDGVIDSIDNKSIILKTTYLQQKAIQHEKRTFLISEALPQTLECLEIGEISFEKQSIELKSFRFVQTSPVNRKTIRVTPEDNHTVSISVGENSFNSGIIIQDISLDAVSLKLTALPAGLDKGSQVILDIMLMMDKKPLIIHTKATLLKKSELENSFELVFLFKESQRSTLVKYITKRQMAIIREFKGLQNG